MIIKMFGKIRMFYNIEIVYTLINSLYYTKQFYIIKIVVLIINSLILYKQFFPYEKLKNIIKKNLEYEKFLKKIYIEINKNYNIPQIEFLES